MCLPIDLDRGLIGTCWCRTKCRGVNPGGGGRDPHRFWAGGRKGSWTDREILLYLIMYRKYGDFWREI